jgi:hypothetical protein
MRRGARWNRGLDLARRRVRWPYMYVTFYFQTMTHQAGKTPWQSKATWDHSAPCAVQCSSNSCIIPKCGVVLACVLCVASATHHPRQKADLLQSVVLQQHSLAVTQYENHNAKRAGHLTRAHPSCPVAWFSLAAIELDTLVELAAMQILTFGTCIDVGEMIAHHVGCLPGENDAQSE